MNTQRTTQEISLFHHFMIASVILFTLVLVTGCANENQTLPVIVDATSAPTNQLSEPSTSPEPGAASNSDAAPLQTPVQEKAAPAKKTSSQQIAQDNPPLEAPVYISEQPAAVQLVAQDYNRETKELLLSYMTSELVTAQGTCTVVATQGNQSFTATSKAEPDAQVTYCIDLSVKLPSSASGEWTINAEFSSPQGNGKSITAINLSQ